MPDRLWQGQGTAARCSRQIRYRMGRAVSAALGILFPPVCTVCGRDLEGAPGGIMVCAACRSQITEERPSCMRCARPLPSGAVRDVEGCPACRGKRFRFTRTVALGIYGGVLREAVIRMKQGVNDPLAISLAQLLALHRFEGPAPDLIVPVPMHWLRRVTRGVNCPEILGEVLGRGMRVPVAGDLLRCRRKTKKQGTLLPTERRANVRGAYAVSTGYDINDAHVLVVDDVMTTGATGNELAKVLRRAGAASVSIAVVARGIGFD